MDEQGRVTSYNQSECFILALLCYSKIRSWLWLQGRFWWHMPLRRLAIQQHNLLQGLLYLRRINGVTSKEKCTLNSTLWSNILTEECEKLFLESYAEGKFFTCLTIVRRPLCSVTRCGDFLHVLVIKLSNKSSPNIWVPFLIMSLLCKKCEATFWAFLVKIRQLFISSSGHTAS